MRAYMSDADLRYTRKGATWDVGEAQIVAMCEACAILAENEPEDCGSYQRLTWLGDWSGDVAESLARFIEAEA